ncbi:MAG: FtsX-like permease family protein [Gammaproteobacteria bacterium]|nr:FtsX-like permease family protein [Gammaproteobacteria bacterium]
MRIAALAWRQVRRDLAAGDVRILLAALVLAVVAVTSVGFVTDRAARALAIEANRVLGGDAVLRSDSPIQGPVREAAQAAGLRTADTVELDTMVRVGEGDAAQLRLGELRAIGEGFPLRGEYRIVDGDGGERAATGVPAPGTLWMGRGGADTLGARIGDLVGIGNLELRLVALVAQEPDAALDYFNVAPRVFIHPADLAATGLVQEGSRVRYRLVVAGEVGAVERFTDAARDHLARGQRLETAADARPEIRSALDRAGRFLGLAALVSVVLAAVAVAMAARRHSARHLQGAAVMRCLGASQATLAGIHIGGLLLLGLLGCTLGVAIAWLLQWAIGSWLGSLLGIAIPPAGPLPALRGYGMGMVVLLAFAAPPVLALRRVPARSVRRRDLDPTEPAALAVLAIGIAGIGAQLWWQAGSATLALAMLAGIGATLGVLALLAWLMILAVRRLRGRLRGSARYGLANVSRRAGTSIAQVSALGLGLMALLLLTFVRTDLLERWQLSLAEEAPNRFIVNVQRDQMAGVAEVAASQGLAEPVLYPMVRGRLATHDGRAVGAARAADAGEPAASARAQRRADREFNLSTARVLRDDNRVTAGRFWEPGGADGVELSVEAGFAASLGWELGDRVGFDIAGRRLEGRITSLREVDWESFRPNFFVLFSPGALDGYPASWITAVSVPEGDTAFTRALVQRYPNVSVIDVDAVLAQVRGTADQVSTVVEVVVWFALGAGLLVLLAAVSASQDERLLEGGVMRVLGASRRQLRLAQASEFAAIGLISGLVAAVAASLLAGVVATRVFDLPWTPDVAMAALGAAAGTLAALVAGLWATRQVLDAPPAVTLRGLEG